MRNAGVGMGTRAWPDVFLSPWLLPGQWLTPWLPPHPIPPIAFLGGWWAWHEKKKGERDWSVGGNADLGSHSHLRGMD